MSAEEPIVINKYGDGDGPESLTDEIRVEYWRARYEGIKREYRELLLAKEESKLAKDEALQDRVRKGFEQNWQRRKVIVCELIRLGHDPGDKYVPRAEASNA